MRAQRTPARVTGTRPTVLFIAGLGRSGSTMLERVLGEAAGVAALGEVVHLWRRGVRLDETCGCGSPFRSCPFWTEVGERAFGGWQGLSVDRVEELRDRVDRARRLPAVVLAGRRPATAALLHEYTDYYARVYRAAAEVAGAEVLVDSSKHPSLAFGLSTRDDLSLRVLHLVRDPRAVAYSWSRTVRRPEAGDVDQEMWRYSPREAALQWVGHNAMMEAFRLTDSPQLLLRHEDFTADPAGSVRRITDWLGLPPDLPLGVGPDGVAHLTTAHTASGNPARFASGDVPIAAAEDWRTALPPEQRRMVTALTLPLLARYGYPVLTPAGAS